MIVLFCMLIVLALSHCDDLPSRIEVESSINRTINEVERLIRQNSSLPNLSRHEIVNILSNITSKDIETYQDKNTINKARDIYQKALMVVLPYKVEDAKEDIKDLYTKPPIVKIIADPSSNTKNSEIWKNERLQLSTSLQETRRDKQPLENLVVAHVSEKTSPKESPPAKTRYKNHRETYSDVHTKVPLKETLKFDSAPIKFSFNLENLQKQSTIGEELVTTRRPVFQSSSPAKDEEVYVVYSTSATTMRTVGSSPRNVLTDNSKESQTTSYPSKYDNVLSADQWRYNAPTSTIRSPTTSTKVPDSFIKKVPDKQPFLPTVISSEDVMAPTVSSNIKASLETSKGDKVREDTKVADIEQPISIYVTPMSSTSIPSSVSEKSKYSSTYSLNSGGFRRITTTTTTMRPEVMDLLASIGLRPENTTNVEEVFEKNKKKLEIKSQIPNSNGFSYAPTSGLTAIAPDTPSIAAQNTFESPVSEIGKGMNNLTPDVQLLFQRFGLQTSNPATSTTSTTLRPTVNTNSYTNFKPLPTSKVKNEDMKEFLARFGLGVNDNRQKKAMPASTERPSLIEAVPSNMRQILENIGLISRKTTPKVKNVVPTEATKFHVFKPHEVRVKDESQRMKINELLDTIRLVQEGKASATDVRKVADDLLVTTKTLKDGPDPLSLEEIVRIYNEDIKNEVKRQQKPEDTVNPTTNGRDLTNTTSSTESIDNISSTTISTTTTTTVTSTTSDSAKDGSDFLGALTSVPESSTSADINLVALEESFGGSTRAPDPVLPTRRRNGLYFLVDWNTFLEVGEEDSEKVNLRFQPKVGDRTRFLPVNVP